MADDLLALALDDPVRAEGPARTLTQTAGSPGELALAHQALAIALRDQGRVGEALPELGAALRCARRDGDAARLADVLGTSGITLVVAGRTRTGLRQLDESVAMAATPRALMRRASAYTMLGRYRDAHADNAEALTGFRQQGDALWEARTLHNLGHAEMSWGRLDEAERHTSAAAELLVGCGRDLEAAWARQNLGEIAFARGDLPAALRTYDAVAADYARSGHQRPHLATVRARAYLAAGLVDEAAAVVQAVLGGPGIEAKDRALLELTSATAELDRQNLDEAAAAATAAARALRGLGDDWFATRACLVAVRARARRGDTGRRLATEAQGVADVLDRARADEAPVALVVASRLSEPDVAAELLGRAASYRSSGTDLVRATGWLARALERSAAQDRGGVLRACGRGLDALDAHRRLLGSTELRALATGHGSELAALAVRHAAGDPRTLLRWTERWRSTALAQAPVTPGDRPVMESLAALRDVTRRTSEARLDGEPTDDLERERARLERLVRAEHHRLSGADPRAGRVHALDVERLVAAVGEEALVELVDVDGVLHVLLVHRGRVRRYVAGTTADALALADAARFHLRRSARGRPYLPGDLGARLERVLLGEAGRRLPEGAVVVVPTARLHGVPWAMLPALRDRAFGVVPSAAQWLRARDAVPAAEGEEVVLLTGPGLGTGGAEVPVLARRRPDAVHLAGADATVDAALAALDGARLAHLAAHGRFRADSPLFSSLELADGPLTVHDLERLAVAPHRVVLSACESGVLAPVGADELLGLASALFALGTAGLVCSVAEVNDEATAALMVDLHGHLERGTDPATALLRVRQAAQGDVAAATAAAFVPLGV